MTRWAGNLPILWRLSIYNAAVLSGAFVWLVAYLPRGRAPYVAAGLVVALVAQVLLARRAVAPLETERRESGRRMLASQEEHGRAVARDLHDAVGQNLTGVLLQLEHSCQRAPPSLQPELLEVRETARMAMSDLHRAVNRLRPEALDDLGLRSALACLAERISAETGLRVTHALDRGLPTLCSESELVIYRIAQESLTNAARHADASGAELRLEVRDRGVRLRVLDDGCGLADTVLEGEGMRGMRERALLVGAHLSFRRHPRSAGVWAYDPIRLELPEVASDFFSIGKPRETGFEQEESDRGILPLGGVTDEQLGTVLRPYFVGETITLRTGPFVLADTTIVRQRLSADVAAGRPDPDQRSEDRADPGRREPLTAVMAFYQRAQGGVLNYRPGTPSGGSPFWVRSVAKDSAEAADWRDAYVRQGSRSDVPIAEGALGLTGGTVPAFTAPIGSGETSAFVEGDDTTLIVQGAYAPDELPVIIDALEER